MEFEGFDLPPGVAKIARTNPEMVRRVIQLMKAVQHGLGDDFDEIVSFIKGDKRVQSAFSIIMKVAISEVMQETDPVKIEAIAKALVDTMKMQFTPNGWREAIKVVDKETAQLRKMGLNDQEIVDKLLDDMDDLAKKAEMHGPRKILERELGVRGSPTEEDFTDEDDS